MEILLRVRRNRKNTEEELQPANQYLCAIVCEDGKKLEKVTKQLRY